MVWMNEWDIGEAVYFFDTPDTPNLSRGAQVLNSLMNWANRNSDGWPYWQKPSRAAARLMERLEESRRAYWGWHGMEDLTDAELTAAFRPIKSFLTREGVDHKEVFE